MKTKVGAAVCALLAMGVMTGCSNNLKPVSQSVTNMQLDTSAKYVKAQDSSKVHTQVVNHYVPVPVPGQLMQKPEVNSVDVDVPSMQGSRHVLKKARQQKKAPSAQTVVHDANQHATKQPNRDDFFNSMMTYNYMPGALYTVYTAPLTLTDIMLQPGEKIISIAAGDTLRWQISQTYSGSAGDQAQHIIVKPNNPSLSNTLLVTTDRRVYHLVLKSTKNDTYMVQVKWHYPGDSNLIYFSKAAQRGAMSNSTASSGSDFKLDLGRLDFNYEFGTVKGNQPGWYPVRVFNNGRQTFIEFPENFYNSELPVLYVSHDGKSYGTMVNWRLKGRYMIVDSVIHNARLQAGVNSKHNQTIVQIQHT